METYSRQRQQILAITGELFSLLEPLRDPSEELLGRLDQARSNYRWHLGFVISAGCAAAAMLLGLVHRAHKWVIRPIRDLHQGARRVADGDFDYRLKLRTDDEMAELAGDFNQMTERFQAVRNDLDRQVQERVKQLIRSERLAGVGFLAAGVAHEINNPLSAIAMAAESLEYRVQDWLPAAESETADEVREYLRMMQTEAQRCRQITEKLLDFARGKEGERNLYDITAIVREVVAMTRHLGRFQNRTIDVNRDAPCYTWVNGPEIKQVVLNLVANALESTDDDGRLEITITERPDQVEYCRCSRAEIRRGGAPAADGGLRYPGTCRARGLPAGGWRASPDPIRLRLPAGRLEPVDEGGVDLAQDPGLEMGDPVLRRRDGAIAYHLAVVVDDAAEGVTRVVRGRDLATSTAIHGVLQRSLGLPTPSYRHHLLLLEERGAKLAKLHGAVGWRELRAQLSPEALCGWLAFAVELQPEPRPRAPRALLDAFAWSRVRRSDLVVRWTGRELVRVGP